MPFKNIHSKLTIALIGDSHAKVAYPGIARLGERLGCNILLMGRFPEWIKHPELLQKYESNILGILKEHKDIKIVIFLVRGAMYMAKEENRGNRSADPLPKKTCEQFMSQLQNFIQKITSLEKEVILVEDNPDLDSNMKDIIGWKNFKTHIHQDRINITQKKDVEKRHSQFKLVQKELAKLPNVVFLEGTLDAFCKNETCELFSPDGIPLYSDDNHLSETGSEKFAREILEPYFMSKAGSGT